MEKCGGGRRGGEGSRAEVREVRRRIRRNYTRKENKK
mgnify:CR=1 FL=1